MTDDRDSFSHVFFIDASSKEALSSGFEAIARDSKAGDSSAAALSWRGRQHSQWLLVLDNADDPTLDLNPWIPSCTHGNILITSRNEQCRMLAPNHFTRVEALAQTEAIQLLLRCCLLEAPSTGDVEIASCIVMELGCLALAIVQAGSYVANCSSLQNYQRIYRSNRATLLSLRSVQGYSEYEHTVYTTWDISYQKLNSQARRLHCLCSFLHFAHIPRRIFEEGSFQGFENEIHFDLAVAELRSYSLLTLNHPTTYSVHPLVHQWSRDRLNDGENAEIRAAAIGLLASCVNWRFEASDYSWRRELLLHAIVALEDSKLEDLDPMHLFSI